MILISELQKKLEIACFFAQVLFQFRILRLVFPIFILYSALFIKLTETLDARRVVKLECLVQPQRSWFWLHYSRWIEWVLLFSSWMLICWGSLDSSWSNSGSMSLKTRKRIHFCHVSRIHGLANPFVNNIYIEIIWKVFFIYKS